MKKKNPVRLEDTFMNLKIISTGGLLALLFLGSVVVGLLLWSFYAWIPIKVWGNGVVVSKNGLQQVTSKIDGNVFNIHVKQGQRVKEGELLVTILNLQEELKRGAAKIKLENIQQEYQRLENQINLEGSAIKLALQREIESNNFAQQQKHEEIDSLQIELDNRKKLYDKGLISLPKVEAIESSLTQNEIDIETIKEKLASLNVELNKGYRVEELLEKTRQLNEQKKELAILEAELENEKIVSPQEGVIIALLKDVGQLVKLGEPLLTIEVQSQEGAESFVVYSYFPIETGKNIERGTPLEIQFDHLNEREYGSMLGVVGKISPYAVSPERVLDIVYNKELVSRLFQANAVVMEVVGDPLKNPDNPKEYLWNRGIAPRMPITTGSTCRVAAIVEEKLPIYFIFPFESYRRRPKIEIGEELK